MDMDTDTVGEQPMDPHSRLMEQMEDMEDMEDMEEDMEEDMDMDMEDVTAREILPVHSMMARKFQPK